MFQFTATVRLGSAAQIQKKILGTATMHVWVDNEHIIDLYDWHIKEFDGKLAAMPPQRMGGQDAQTGKPRYFNNFRLFPADGENRQRYYDAQNVIINEYQKTLGQGAGQGATPVGAVTGPPGAAQSPPPAQPVTQAHPSAGGQPAPPPGPAAPAPPGDGGWAYGTPDT